ncbi:MAG: response regulator, partial [Bacteroides acidifaciens]|nr:response regulator [Bacteroides acidifaciens]
CKAGEIFLGGVKGMISFYEKDLDIPLKPYNIIPARLWVNGDEVGANDETGILHSSLYNVPSITLKSNHSVLSIEFAMTNYIAANKNELVYKLEGFSNEWAQTHGQKMITYTNLPAGNYTLIVKAAGANHVYQPECRLAITVLPPFYKTGWAYLLYVIVIGVILFYLIKAYRDRIRLQESLKYEQQHIHDVEELNQSKLRFFTNISHEFRTPLTIIIGQIEMLLQGQSFSPTAYNKLLNIYKNGLQLRELISELLDFRKQEQGHMKIKVSRHELIDFLYENYLLYVEYAATCNIHFQFDKGEERLEVWYDSRQLQKVINNLLSNAFKYTPKGGTISLNVYKKGEEAVIEVCDSGTGIRPEEIEKIFERFYQVGGDSGNIQGTGIGLALSKGIIELHKGRIEVSSHLDKGTTFTIYLKLGKEHFLKEQIDTEPVKEEPLSMPAEPQLQLEQQVMDEDVQNRIKGAKMLIVEDNTSLREMLAGLFEPYYEVLTASDGEEGLQKVQEVMPDIIISDIMMPKMTGIELCKQIKANFETCHIPVVLLTARTAIEHTIEGLRIGADDYITKPFNVNLLISRCNNLVNSRRVLQEKFGKQPQTQVQMLATNPMDKDLLDRTVAIIERNLDNSEYSLSDLIKELYISRTNFFTKIKAITGQTPNEFILTIRLKKAAWLLKHEQYLSITEVSDRTGFSSQRYFSRCFKDMYGISPLYYRTGGKEDNQEE